MKILMRNPHDKDWRLVDSAGYSNEAELQHLFAESPGLISVNDIREGSGSLVLAVSEFNLPTGSIDILAFSAEGDIVIIECKLSSNYEMKRKVIGQVLEYGSSLWQMSYEELDQGIRLSMGESLIQLMEKRILDDDWDEEEFRANVEEILANGNFILIIVVDEIKEELARIVRYMNTCGSHGFDFAALEMRRFHSGDAEMLVPRLFGPPNIVQTRLQKEFSFRWDEDLFFAELRKKGGENAVYVARRLLDWSEKNLITWWGKGKRSGSFVPYFYNENKQHQLFAVWTYGSLEIYFYWYAHKPPFDVKNKRLELLHMLNQIQGIDLPVDAIDRRPSIRLTDLRDDNKIDQFLTVFDWMVSEIQGN